jgi:hypothetical protein
VILLVDEQLFIDEAVKDVDRLALLRLAALRGHTIIHTPRPVPNAQPTQPDPVEEWCNSLRERARKEARTLLESARSIPPKAPIRGAEYVLVSNRWRDLNGRCVLTLGESIRVIGEPLHVLVENGLRDAAFLRRVMPKDWRRKITEWESTGRIRFEHAGGISEMEAIVNFLAEGDGALGTWGMPAEAWKKLHFVVFDHDGESSGAPGDGARALDALCKKLELSERSHMLERRRQEYYLPREAMEWLAREELTNATERAKVLAEIDAFFNGGQRTHGPLPKSPNDGWWKHRFWRHRDEPRLWQDDWFRADGAWPEMTRLAEALQRVM